MPDNYLRLYVHLIWKTWDHLPLLTPDVCGIVYPVLLGKARELGCKTLALGGVEDHVHQLVRIPPTLDISRLVKELKGASSRHAHLTFPQRNFKWRGSYGAISVSPATLPTVMAYIANQKDHHQRNYLEIELETCELDENAPPEPLWDDEN